MENDACGMKSQLGFRLSGFTTYQQEPFAHGLNAC